MPNGPTSREIDGKGADGFLPIGLVLAAVVATLFSLGLSYSSLTKRAWPQRSRA